MKLKVAISEKCSMPPLKLNRDCKHQMQSKVASTKPVNH